MKSKLITTTLLLTCLGISHSFAQGFDPGSNGSFGPLTVTVNTKLDLPTNGIFQCTTITVAAGAKPCPACKGTWQGIFFSTNIPKDCRCGGCGWLPNEKVPK